MLRKWFLLFGAVLVLALGACSNDDDANRDPVEVDLSLPPVAELPSFGPDVELVDTEDKEAVLTLAGGALAVVMDNLGSAFPLESYVNPSLRAVQTENIDEVYDHEIIKPGVTLTGFVQGQASATEAIIDGNIDASQPGDFVDINLRTKMEVACEDLQDGNLTITGKYYLQGDPIRGRAEFSENAATMSGTENLKGGYALSVSDSRENIGAKLVLTLDVRGIETIDLIELFLSPPKDFNPFNQFLITVKVYDDKDELKNEFTYHFDDVFSDIMDELGAFL
jgi:hypothetical protein